MVDEIVENLEKGKYLLSHITDVQYSDKSIAPYHSSIGGHIRHILDVFNCVLVGFSNNTTIDLTKRDRNINVETFTNDGLLYIDDIISRLNSLELCSLKDKVLVTDNLGTTCHTVETTLAGILVQAHSHAIHHFATIGYMMHCLQIELPMDSFGVNPTTPKMKMVSGGDK